MNVPPLETRLAEAKQFWIAKQAEHKPIADAHQAMQSAFQKISGDLATAQKQSAEAKQKADAAAVALSRRASKHDQSDDGERISQEVC